MNEHIKSNASRFGLISAGVSIGYTLMAYLFNLELMVNFWIGLILMLVSITIPIISVIRSRKMMGGFITFKEAFTSFVVTYIVSAAIVTVFSVLLFTVIEPGLADQIKELTIAKTTELMEKFGSSDEQIEQSILAIEEQDSFSLIALLRSFLIGIVGYSVIGLIVAAATKKDKPIFENDESEFGQND